MKGKRRRKLRKIALKSDRKINQKNKNLTSANNTKSASSTKKTV